MLQTVLRTYSPAEAAVVASLVRAAGCPYHITNWNIGHAAPHYQFAVGGFEIQVPATASEDLAALLNEVRIADAAQASIYENETAAFRRALPTWGLLGLSLSLWAGVPVPTWVRARLPKD